MQSTTNVSKFYKGSGSLLFDRYDADGASQGYLMLGNGTAAGVTTTDNRESVRDFTMAAQPECMDELQERTVEFTVKLKQFERDNLMLALMGSAGTAYTQLATAVVDEDLGPIYINHLYQVAKRQIGTVSLETTDVTPVALVEGTDYEIFDADGGWIKILPTLTNATEGDTVHVSYTPTAIAAPGLAVIDAGKETTITGRLKFVGDPAQGDTNELTVWLCSVTPDGELPLIGNQTGEFGLKFKALSDGAHADLFQVLRLVEAA